MSLINPKLNKIILLILFITPLPLSAAKYELATLAGGCFWSMQHDFDKLPGVVKTTVGYTGGQVVHPTYHQVSTGQTGHYEAIQIIYDPSKTNYQTLLNFYWHDIDPSNASGQFCDRGNEYKTVIFYHNATQQKIAVASKKQLNATNHFNHIATLIKPASIFYPAESYHQKYAEKNPEAYARYREGCGRDHSLKKIWGDL